MHNAEQVASLVGVSVMLIGLYVAAFWDLGDSEPKVERPVAVERLAHLEYLPFN